MRPSSVPASMALRSAASAALAGDEGVVGASAFLTAFPSFSSSRTARAFSRTSGDAASAFAWMASMSSSSSPPCMALCSAASAAIAGDADSVGVFASRISSLSLARRARASSSTSSDARSALAWMASTRVSSWPRTGHGPFIALRTAASALDCTLGSIPLRTAASASACWCCATEAEARPADFTLWPAASKCSESAPADGWLKKGGRATMATSASNISGTGPKKLLLIWQVRTRAEENYCVGYSVT